MRYIHVSLNTLRMLFDDFKGTKLSVYDTTYKSDSMTFVGVYLIMQYDKGLLLIREYDAKGSAKLPCTFLSIPDYMKTPDVLTHEADLDEIIQWDVVHALCELREDFTSYDAALRYGPMKIVPALNNLYGIKVSSSIFYSIVGKTSPDDKIAKIYCCVTVDDVNWDTPSASQLVYVPYLPIKNYHMNKQGGLYENVYRDEMDKVCPIYSNYDDRISYPDTIVEGFELYRNKLKLKNVL